MNSRTIVIAIVAAFALCCIGSGAVMTLSVLEKALASAKNPDPTPVVTTNPKKDDDDEQGDDEKDDAPVAPPADTDDSPDDDETIPTANTDEPPDFLPPEEGVSTFAIYYAKKSKVPALGALKLASKGTVLHALKNTDEIEDAETPFVSLEEQTTLDYPVNSEALEADASLDAVSRKLVAGSQSVAVLTIITSGSPEEERDAQKAVLAFAKATGGVVWDDDSGEFLNAVNFKAQRLDSWQGSVPMAQEFYSVVHNPGAKTTELATRGLKRFALPEIELHDVSKADEAKAVLFLSVVAQALVENQDAPPDLKTELTISLAGLKHDGFRKQLEPQVSGTGIATITFKVGAEEAALQVLFKNGSLREFFGN
jgi:hypothetical protein